MKTVEMVLTRPNAHHYEQEDGKEHRPGLVRITHYETLSLVAETFDIAGNEGQGFVLVAVLGTRGQDDVLWQLIQTG